jgi:hypothetical protein
MRTTLLLLTSLALAACQRTAPVTADDAAPASSVPTPPEKADPQPAGVATLEGHWRVAGIDGKSLDEPVAIALTASDRQIWWEPRCAGMARNYRIEGGTIRFTSTLPPRAPGEPTPPVCAIGLPPRLGDVFRALDEANGIVRLPSNGIRIAGPKHDVTIFAQ